MATTAQPTAVFSEQPTALAEVLRDIAAALNGTLDLAEVLDYLPNNNLPPALIEPNMFAQVIANLISNVISYMPYGGLITVSTRMRTFDRQEWITVMVQDTGHGISATD